MVRGYLFFVICRLLSACLEWKERNTIKGSKKEQKFTVMSISMSSVGLFVFLWSDQIPPTPTPAIHFLTSLADFFFFPVWPVSNLFLLLMLRMRSAMLCYCYCYATLWSCYYGRVYAGCMSLNNKHNLHSYCYVCMYVCIRLRFTSMLMSMLSFQFSGRGWMKCMIWMNEWMEYQSHW